MPEYKVPSGDYEGFWRYIQSRSRHSPKGFLQKSKRAPWDAAVNQFKERGKRNDIVSLTGQFDWCQRSEKGILKLTLNPLKLERGNRFCRRFGSDRFLTVTFPPLWKPPEHLKSQVDAQLLLQGVTKWLATSEHHLLGRIWRGFFLEDVKI